MAAEYSNQSHNLETPSLSKRFHTLDSFRGLCALIVVLFHARILLSFSESFFFRNGACFVEFFFMLSGFVLCHTYGKTEFTGKKMKDFMISRIFRLYPMHILMLLFFIGFELLKLYCFSKGMVFGKEPFTDQQAPQQILPNLLLLHAWSPKFRPTSFNFVSWSISVEFYLYVIFALILMFIPRGKKFIFGLISLTALSLLFFHNYIIEQGALRGLYCFFGGCLVYFVYKKFEHNSLNKLVFTLLESLAVIAVILAALAPQDINDKFVYITIIFALVVLVFSFERGALSDFFKTSPFLFLGKLSYSIYMVHAGILTAIIPVMTIAGKYLHKDFIYMARNGSVETRFITTHNVYIDNIFTLLLVGLIITVSYFTYTYIELKGIAFGKKFTKKTPSSQQVRERAIA